MYVFVGQIESKCTYDMETLTAIEFVSQEFS